MDLCLASHRAILKALQAFEDGELTLAVAGPIAAVTREGELRFVDGVCFAAPQDAWIGAEIIGWLEELDGLSGVGAWWRPGLRAVLRTRDGRVAVAGATQDLVAGDEPAPCGFATHTARFIVAHGDSGEVTTSAPRHAIRPPPPPHPAGDVTLRERGTWRTTAVVPWTLGAGIPRTPRPGTPAPAPQAAAQMYTSPDPGVHTAETEPPPAPRPRVYTSSGEGVHTSAGEPPPAPRPRAYTPARAGVHTGLRAAPHPPPRPRALAARTAHLPPVSPPPRARPARLPPPSPPPARRPLSSAGRSSQVA
ncbi:MAG: hypothetical protein R3B70_12195 [Polyangiaceae bacterium]